MEVAGIYFNSERNEVFAKLCEEDSLPGEVSWVRVSFETKLGLMAIREIVVRQGLVNDKETIYWHGLKTKPKDEPEWLLHMGRESPLAA